MGVQDAAFSDDVPKHSGGALSDEAVRHFGNHGWAVVPGFLMRDEIADLPLYDVFPRRDHYFEQSLRFQGLRGDAFASVRMVPTGRIALDRIPFDRRCRAIAQQLLGSEDLCLMRAGYQAKFAGAADFEQELHRDFPNHTLLVPSFGDILGCFLYLSDVTAEDGPTAIVSVADTSGIEDHVGSVSRGERPDLYAAERRIVCEAGSLLVYDYTAFHRATAVTGQQACRLSLSFAYAPWRRWQGFVAWPNMLVSADMYDLIVRLSPEERSLIGFPAIGDAVWDGQTIDAIERRFPPIDMSQYRDAAHNHDDAGLG